MSLYCVASWVEIEGRVTKQSAQVYLHVAVLLFGLSGLFGKWIALDPALIVFGRTLVACGAVALVLRFSAWPPRLRSRRALLLSCLSGGLLALHWGTFFHAIQVSTVAIGLVGFSAFPVFVTLAEPLLGGGRLRAVDLLSTALVVVGLALVAPRFSLDDAGTVGLLWAVVSGALFAVLTLLNRSLVAEQSVMVLALTQQGAAAALTLPWLVVAAVSLPTVGQWGQLLLLGLLCTALPHILFVQSLRRLKAQLASVVAALEPVYGIAFAALLLGEIPGGRTLLGAAVVFAAVMIAVRAHADESPGD